MTLPRRHSILIDGREAPVELRRLARARRITLALDAKSGGFRLTLPPHVGEREALAFLHAQNDWVRRALARLPDATPFTDGAVLPILGVARVIRHCPEAKRGVWLEEGAVCVSGDAAHLERRLTDFLRRLADREIAPRAVAMAGRLGIRIGRVSMRDQKSRWGSCSASGDIRFNWRLICAPPAVMDYVVAHEVAHLVHLNHSPAFWRVVSSLCPDWKRHRTWLRTSGAGLLRLGAAPA